MKTPVSLFLSRSPCSQYTQLWLGGKADFHGSTLVAGRASVGECGGHTRGGSLIEFSSVQSLSSVQHCATP